MTYQSNSDFDQQTDSFAHRDWLSTQHYQYSPLLLGHPHDQASAQYTEPFWWQYPEHAFGTQPVYYYPQFDRLIAHPLYTSSNMDSPNIVIGSGSRYASKAKSGGAPRPAFRRPEKEMVKVFCGEELLKEMPLQQLTRFSEVAARQFPKPANAQGRPEGAKDRPVTGDSQVQASPSSGEALTATTAPVQGVVSITDSSQPPKPIKEFHLSLDCKVLPKKGALTTVLLWMDSNKDKNGTQKLHDLLPQNLETINFTTLVDHYQVALALRLRPQHFRDEIRNEILARLTTTPPDVTRFTYVDNCLPTGDGVVTRMINCFLDFYYDYKYVQSDADAIYDYVKSQPDLFARYRGVDAARMRREKAEKAGRVAAKMQEQWEKVDADDDDDARASSIQQQTMSKPQTSSGENNPASVARTSGNRGRRDRRKKDTSQKPATAEEKAAAHQAVLDALEQEAQKTGNTRGPNKKYVPGAE